MKGFYGIVSFCEVEKNQGCAFLGVYRLEIGWLCKKIGSGEIVHENNTPLQLHEFLDGIGRNRFEFLSYEEAKKRVWGVGVTVLVDE